MSAGASTNGSLIAYFSDAPYTGGAERYLYLLASHIDRDRFEPVMIVNRNPELDRFKSWLGEEKIPVYEVSLRLPFTLKGTLGFIRLVRRLKPSLFHMNLPGPFDSQFSLVAPLARLAGVKHIVSTEHMPMFPSFRKVGMLKRFGTSWIDRVITVSDDNRRHLMHNHGVRENKIRTVHIGIPDPGPREPANLRNSLDLAGDTFLLVMVGALQERKGQRTALKALADLPGSVHLVIAGEGEKEGEYRDYASRLGIGDRVHFLGYRNDVPAILDEADLMVLTSSVEATPYVIIEAMASGLPVVASGVYGIPELVEEGKTGILIQPGDHASLVKAVMSLLNDRGLRTSMKEAARRRYEDLFRIEISVLKTIDVYRELVVV